ncbi:glycine zipper 2TM domain-containing protein [Pelomicrobium sp. G1]|uniref:glycine zipper 2TM domain-containing protein n=1 Tax=unclassified Pelomicrobium TaxID=2815318 RepID=UPI003F758C55
MNNRNATIAFGFVIAAAAVPAAARHDDGYVVARVVSATPVYRQVVEPRQACWFERVAEQERSYTGAVIGGIAGGLLGHQVGKGSGKTLATAAGAVTGALVGDHLANRDRAPGYRDVKRCRTVEHVRQVHDGYEVVYRHAGREHVTVLPHPPGPTVRIPVSVHAVHVHPAHPFPPGWYKHKVKHKEKHKHGDYEYEYEYEWDD